MKEQTKNSFDVTYVVVNVLTCPYPPYETGADVGRGGMGQSRTGSGAWYEP